MSRAVWGGEDIGVLSFIGSNEILGVSKMGKWFPGAFQWGIAFPLVMKLSVGGRALMGDDEFHGVFFFFVDDRGWGR